MTAPQCDFKWQLTDLVIIKATSRESVIVSDIIRVYFPHPPHRCVEDELLLCSKGK